MTQTKNTKAVEIEIKLYINKRLHEMKLITEEMYTRVAEAILRG